MTTLAFDGRYIACDSQVTQGSIKLSADKWEACDLPDGTPAVCMIAGTLAAGRAAIAALVAGGDVLSALGEDTTLLVASAGTVTVYDSEGCWVDPGPYSVGSGAKFAYAGMSLGLSADQAVDLAVQLDLYSSSPVKCWDVRTLKAVKPKAAPKAPR